MAWFSSIISSRVPTAMGLPLKSSTFDLSSCWPCNHSNGDTPITPHFSPRWVSTSPGLVWILPPLIGSPWYAPSSAAVACICCVVWLGGVVSSLPPYSDSDTPCGSLLAASGPRILFFFPIWVGKGFSNFRFFSYRENFVSNLNYHTVFVITLTSFLSFFCPVPPGCCWP